MTIEMTEVEIKKFDDFIEDLIKVYKKHNLSLSHQDQYGDFIVEPYCAKNCGWLKQSYYRNGNGEEFLEKIRPRYK